MIHEDPRKGREGAVEEPHSGIGDLRSVLFWLWTMPAAASFLVLMWATTFGVGGLSLHPKGLSAISPETLCILKLPDGVWTNAAGLSALVCMGGRLHAKSRPRSYAWNLVAPLILTGRAIWAGVALFDVWLAPALAW